MTNRAPPKKRVSTRTPEEKTLMDWVQRTGHPVLSETRDIVEAITQNRVLNITAAGTTTISPDADLVLVDATLGTVVLGFPAAALWEKRIVVIKTDASVNAVVIASTPSTALLAQYQMGEYVCDGTNYRAISSSTLAGDVTGAFSSNTVSKLQGTLLTASGANAPLVGQVLMYDGTQWLPVSRSLKVIDNTNSPVGNWSFDIAPGASVTDSSGNGCTLTAETGTLRTTTIHPTLGGCYFDGATDVYNAAPQAQLQILADLTVLVLGLWADLPAGGAFSTMFSYGLVGETSDTNVLYLGQFDSLSQFDYFSEHGAGVNDPANTLSTAGRYQPFLLGLTRDSGGSLKHWLNGIFAGSPFGTVTLPTDGHNGLIRIGCDQNGGNFFKGILSSVAIFNKVLTADQMKYHYNQTLGGAFGLK